MKVILSALQKVYLKKKKRKSEETQLNTFNEIWQMIRR